MAEFSHTNKNNYIIPLNSEQVVLEQVGGKGVNLLRLVREGFPVPPGFIISTEAYWDFVTENNLQDDILRQIAAVQQDTNLQHLEDVSKEILYRFSEGIIPKPLVEQIVKAYRKYRSPAAAVRSSATTEDLPDLSFAGLQDTFLNIQGEDELLAAVVRCWSSLWSARAIGYRMRNDISQEDISLAVIVQAMVPSQVSGVLFTANPVSGLRSECVIEATYGLGEVLVSGKVEPDTVLVDVRQGRILEKKIGSKSVAIHCNLDGGTQEIAGEAKNKQALDDSQILDLAQLGKQVSIKFGSPQDIEWALVDGKFHLLQTRAITSLYPLPDDLPEYPLKVMFSLAAVQGLFEPITPLGQDAFKWVIFTGSKLFGYKLNDETQTIILTAGERIWINISALLRNRIGRKILIGFMRMVEPGIHNALIQVAEEPEMIPRKSFMRPQLLFRLLHLFLPMFFEVLKNWLAPQKRVERIFAEIDKEFCVLYQNSQREGDIFDRLGWQVLLLKQAFQTLLNVLPNLLPGVLAGFIPMAIIIRIIAHDQIQNDDQDKHGLSLAWRLTGGIHNNVTTEMDLKLWQTAKTIKDDDLSRTLFQNTPAQILARQYLQQSLPPAAQEAIRLFMNLYGMRGIGELDLGRPRWREDPTHIIQVLQNYMGIENEQLAPDKVFDEGRWRSFKVLDDFIMAMRNKPCGKLKGWFVRWLTIRMRTFAGLRESPKFLIIRIMGILRKGFLEVGSDLADSGIIRSPDDLFFLNLAQLEALSRREIHGWAGIIAKNRERYARELKRRQIPRVLISDGRAFHEGVITLPGTGETILQGIPVSAGSVEGTARIVFDPLQAHLSPGDIMVCPGTDPAWTPLFLSISGLAMEMGGMMTHGSVVAREYGIPAVVGVNQVTSLIKDGQRIRIDGSTGMITILDNQ